MHKIELTSSIVETEWLELISTNFKWIFFSIQWDENNRSIVVLLNNEINTLAPSDNLEEKKENYNINIPKWYKVIWTLWNWSYVNWNFKSESHYYKEVDENYRSIWICALMFKIKESLDWILNEEFSRKISWVTFLLRNWFQVKWKINDLWKKTILSEEEKIDLSLLISKYVNFEIDEEILTHTIVFNRKIQKIQKK